MSLSQMWWGTAVDASTDDDALDDDALGLSVEQAMLDEDGACITLCLSGPRSSLSASCLGMAPQTERSEYVEKFFRCL